MSDIQVRELGMQPIPTDHLAAIGQLSLAFALLDDQTSLLLYRLMQCKSNDVAVELVQKRSFDEKLRLANRLIEIHRGCERLTTDWARDAGQILVDVRKIKERRNQLLHAFTAYDGETGELLFLRPSGYPQIYEHVKSCDRKAITDLALAADRVGGEIRLAIVRLPVPEFSNSLD